MGRAIRLAPIFMFETEQVRLKNIQSSMERGLPELQPFPEHGGEWVVCAGGPSLRKEIAKIKKRKGVIVSMNGTHDYLLNKKIVPDVFVLVDAQEHNAGFLNHPCQNTVYYIAAHCHPKVFDKLKGYNVQTWMPLDYGLPMFSIGGGSTVGLRSINIGYALGFRDIHLYGFDGCVKESHHAYPQAANDADRVKEVVYEGKKYRMTDWMCAQADNFDEMMKSLDFKLTVQTNGVIKHIKETYYAS